MNFRIRNLICWVSAPSRSRNAIRKRARRMRMCGWVSFLSIRMLRNGWKSAIRPMPYWLVSPGCPILPQVAVERMNRVQNELDLLFCDASSGAARVVLHEQSKTWINMADNLFLLKSRPEFLWTSELASGFRHIYRYSDKGELLQQLTSGNWEVRSIAAVDEARRKVLLHVIGARTAREPVVCGGISMEARAAG